MESPRRSVLVIDDDVHLLNLICMILEDDCAVSRAENGEDGVRIVRENPPSLLILDMMLPKMSGAEILDELQRVESTRTIPVIVLSAFNFSDDEIKGIESRPNVRALMRKPFSLEKVRQQVDGIIGGADGASRR